jgi:transposase
MEIERPRLSTPRRWEIVHLRLCGQSYQEIADAVKCSNYEAMSTFKKYESEGNVKERLHSGRKKVLNARDERSLVCTVLANPEVPLGQLENEVFVQKGSPGV